MKKILGVLILVLSVLGFAQEGAKVAFQAFDGASFLTIKTAEGGVHKFSLKVEAAPWAFHAIGEARVVAGDPQLLVEALYEGSVYAIVAYVPDSKAMGKDGKEYNVGVFDVMLYYDDEPVSVRNVKFKLLPPADEGVAKGLFDKAMGGRETLGALWGGNYEREITTASATPVDKKTLQDMNRPKPEPKPAVESDDEDETPFERRKKKMVAEDEGADDDGAQLSTSEKRRRIMDRKKKQAEEDEEEEEPVVKKKKKKKAVEEDEEEPVVKKKKKKKAVEEDEEEPVVKKKKKKKAVEEDEEEPVVKKKKKKKVVEEDEEEPVVKKKKKKKVVEDDEEEPVVKKKKKKKKSYDEDED